MITISSTNVQKNFGAFLDKGSREIVIIKRQNREVGAFIPMADLVTLRKAKADSLRSAVNALSEEGEANGFTENLLNEILADVNPS
ncbi:MAG: hypothetical protein ACSHX0_13430 [Akkermansiaceae bacterium]